MKVFNAIVNSTDTDDGLDVTESADLPSLPSAERWINRRADRFLGASIYEIEREIESETEISHRIYMHDEHGRFVLDDASS